MPTYTGGCHCDTIKITLTTPEESSKTTLNACPCSFCRKHGVRTYFDPSATVVLTNYDTDRMYINCYGHKEKTGGAILCKECGVCVCMLHAEEEEDENWEVVARTTVNVNCLDDQKAWAELEVQAKNYDEDDPIAKGMTRAERRARVERQTRYWCPTRLVGWRRHDYGF